MNDQPTAKKVLQDLGRRQDLSNTTCADCRNPNPQWASVTFAIFLCLQCAGVHRGFGVHISFVRSVSMDTWQPDQLNRMQLGGNAPFIDFVRAYSPAEQGGYTDGMDTHALYHCWAATQYREKARRSIPPPSLVLTHHKLDHALAGKPWAPSSPPPAQLTVTVPTRPSSAQGLRKSRASARSPPTSHTPQSSESPHADQKSANEAYFTSLGLTNAARPTDLPPSQGGRYQGFGNTPSPAPSQHPSFGLTSATAPSLADLQDNPAAALSKGWSLFSAVVAGASRVVNDNVIQPGVERVMDPNLHASVRGYVSEAHRRAQVAGQSANEWSKGQLGVDVADHVSGIVGTVRDTVAPGPSASGYGSLALHDEAETSALYNDDNDLFHEYPDTSSPSTTSKPALGSHVTDTPGNGKAKKGDDWDEWHDF